MCKEQVTILIADDDLDDQAFLTEAIGALNPAVRIKLFDNGGELLSYISSVEYSEPCLIVLDYNMPVFSGAEVLDRMARDVRLSHVPKIVWSTSNSSFYMDKCLSKGALRYFIKPVDSQSMRSVALSMLQACSCPC